MLINSDVYVDRLLKEISKSADNILTRKLISTTKRFPKKRGIQNRILSMIKDGHIIFPYQEAECLRAIRYLSTLNEEIYNHAWGRLIDAKNERYLRMQSAYLLSRSSIEMARLDKLKRLFDTEADPYVQAALATLLVQCRNDNQEIVQSLLFHPNERTRNMGKFFQTIKNNTEMARKTLQHAFNQQAPWMLCDYMSVLHLMGESKKLEIRRLLLNAVRGSRMNYPIGGLRNPLKEIFTRTRLSLL